MTLRELISEKGFKVWLATKANPYRKFFKPIAVSESRPELVLGEGPEGYEDSWLIEDDRFIPYETFEDSP